MGASTRGVRPGNERPIEPPSFTRHYRYNEFSLYAEESLKLLPRLTLTAGLRWEYFGVLHSPDGEKNLDGNFYLATREASSSACAAGAFRQTDQFFNQDFNNFARAWPCLGCYGKFANGISRPDTAFSMMPTSASFVQRNSESARLCRRSSARRTHLPEPVRYPLGCPGRRRIHLQQLGARARQES